MFDFISIKFNSIEYEEFKSIDLNKVRLLIIPSDVKKDFLENNKKVIKEQIKKGMYIIIEKQSNLAKEFGIKSKDLKSNIKTIIDKNHKDIDISLEDKLQVEEFGGNFDEIFYISKKDKIPLMMGIDYFEGKILFLATNLDKIGNFGYNRFLFFHEILNQYLSIKPRVSRENLSVYLDWGFSYDKDLDKLAKELKEAGVNQLHISSWYCNNSCEIFTKKLIDSCHSQNILVYMWLELPMVSKSYWDENPNLRQKTATLDDAHIDWRYLMAVENKKCMDDIKTLIKTMVQKFDFDGIDLAELYFESPGNGFEEPSKFTPMSNIIRDEFMILYGVDPIEIFDSQSAYYYKNNKDIKQKFIDYRINLCKELNEELIKYIKKLDVENKLNIILTQIDSNIDSNMKEKIAVDMDEFIKLQNRYEFILQVEDPYTLWNLGHNRYKDIIKYYEGKIKKENIYMDINIVDRNGKVYPYKKQTGLEAISLVSTASNAFEKLCLYEYNTINKFDFDYLKYAISNDVEYKKIKDNIYSFKSPYKFKFELDMKNKDVFLDDKKWIYYNDKEVTIPKGEHTLILKDRLSKNTSQNIIDINGEIDYINCYKNKLLLEYTSKDNKYISLTFLPEKIFVNGEQFPIKSIYKNNYYTIFCPRGKNKICFEFDTKNINCNDEINLSVDGQVYNINGDYIIKNDKMLFEMNKLMSYLDAKYTFNEEYNTLSANLNDYYIWMEANNKKALANGKKINLEVDPKIENGKMMLPLRFVCNYLNCEINWREKDRIIEIIKK